MTAAEIGRRGAKVAAKLWSLRLVHDGSQDDFCGVDAHDENGKRVQIKTDRRIRDSENFFHEVYKRDGAWASFKSKSAEWRISPSNADVYVFVTSGWSVKVSVCDLAVAEIGLELRQIHDTAIGFVIPFNRLGNKEMAKHDEWFDQPQIRQGVAVQA